MDEQRERDFFPPDCYMPTCIICTLIRSRSRSYSQWYDRPTTSRYRSCSSSPERRPSPRRRDFSPRRNEGRRPSPMRSRERRWSPRRNEERRSPQRSRRERRSSTEGSSPQRMSSSAETLAKKLLETSGLRNRIPHSLFQNNIYC